MLYYKCVSCRRVLANKQLLYEQQLEKVTMDNKLSSEQKDDAKRKILDDLMITNICCRARVLGYVRLIDLIK